MQSVFSLALVVLIFFSCKKKDDEAPNTTQQTSMNYLHGKYVVNEGSYGQNNGSISYISDADELTNDIYLQLNNAELGDVFQSLSISGDKAYAVMNNSQKVEVIDLNTMKHLKTITGLDYPRHMIQVGNTVAYLTNGSGAGVVKIMNTATDESIGEIAVGNGPEKMVLSGNYVFVCNSGGFLTDNTVSVINILTNTVIATITVGDRPVDAVSDAYGHIWVLCSGETLYDQSWNVIGNTEAKVFRIDVSTLLVSANQTVGDSGDHPFQLEISPDGSILYYENQGVFAFSLNGADWPGTEIISEAKGSLNVDPSNGDLWCASVSDFSTPSSMYRYSSTGSLLKSWQVGIGTNCVVFN